VADAGTPAARRRSRRLLVAGLVTVAVFAALAIAAPLCTRYDPNAIVVAHYAGPEPPSAAHPLGTDLHGRDVLARVAAGARLSVSTGLVAAALGLLLGSGVGLLSALSGDRVDGLLMRAVDTLAALPTLVIAILLLAALGSGLPVLVLAIGLTEWFIPARVVRAEARRIRGRDFVEAARNLGLGGAPLVARHVVPHLVPALAASLALTVPRAILAEAFLSFIGIGAAPPAVSLGGLLSEAVSRLEPISRSALPVLVPAAALAAILAAVNAAGESWREAASPRRWPA
jgi:ABC-type dipeptide/oligopeptide/nickel transport system permease subunit